jgi:serine/threonine-protein kinase
MGVVYLARDTKLRRPVAIKILPDDVTRDPERRARFEREAQTAASLNHPNIGIVHEFAEVDGSCFIVMEYVDGRSLAQLVQQEEQIEPAELLEIAGQVAQGLEAAHARNVIHRDLKPGNVMLTADKRVKILDFGLAKAVEATVGPTAPPTAVPTALTEPGQVMGTVDYMSPEQARGLPLDARSDLFSLGAVLYEMASGRPPFRRSTTADTLSAVLNEKPRSLAEVRPALPPALARTIEKLLRKRPEDRCQSAAEVGAALRAAKEGCAAPSTDELKSIAVLPFADMSPGRDQEYFCDGLAEELINALAQIPGLRVAARTSAFQFKDKAVNVETVGRDLKVNNILEGSVRKAGNRLRITAQLVKASDGYHLWSQRYDRDLEDVFAVQDEITRTIVDTLKLELAGGRPRLVRCACDDVETYNLYLKGRYHWNRRTEESVRKAIECFEQAIERDPGYALPYVGIADSLFVLANYGPMAPREAYPEAEAAARKALELDDTLAEAHASLAQILYQWKWDWPAAEREFKRALELNPSYLTAHHWYSMFLAGMERYDEALAEIRRAQELDPLSPVIGTVVAVTLYGMRRYDEALREARKVIELDPTFPVSHEVVGTILLTLGEPREAVAALRQAAALSPISRVIGTLGEAYAFAGMTQEAHDVLAELEERRGRGAAGLSHLALVHMGLGDLDRAFECLEQAVEEREGGILLDLVSVPEFDPLRSDPRFDDLLRRIGLPT